MVDGLMLIDGVGDRLNEVSAPALPVMLFVLILLAVVATGDACPDLLGLLFGSGEKCWGVDGAEIGVVGSLELLQLADC